MVPLTNNTGATSQLPELPPMALPPATANPPTSDSQLATPTSSPVIPQPNIHRLGSNPLVLPVSAGRNEATAAQAMSPPISGPTSQLGMPGGIPQVVPIITSRSQIDWASQPVWREGVCNQLDTVTLVRINGKHYIRTVVYQWVGMPASNAAPTYPLRGPLPPHTGYAIAEWVGLETILAYNGSGMDVTGLAVIQGQTHQVNMYYQLIPTEQSEGNTSG
ncbi:MAG: NADH:ubiquinone oxidoreductase [Watsoniomyces obsoletus]|nr:MAG: NADH:ubiquinone oxidoreductase [Watsoniomyces obsoletus]